MSLLRPMEIEEGNEREQLKDWEWGHDVTPLDNAAINGANVILDQIKSDAQLFLVAEDKKGSVECTVNLFGEFFLTFDITEELKDLADDYIDGPSARKAWEDELQSRKDLSTLFRSIADEIDRRCEKVRAKGTLDEEYGMGYDEWHEKQGTLK